MGHDLAEAHPALRDVRHDASHLAGRGAAADQLELVEDEPRHVDLDALVGMPTAASGRRAAACRAPTATVAGTPAPRGRRPRRGRRSCAHGRDRVARAGVDGLEAHLRGLREAAGARSTMMTRPAPRIPAASPPSSPMAPAPVIATVSPGRMPPRLATWSAIEAGSMTAPSSNSAPSGSGKMHFTPWTTYVASAPWSLWPYWRWSPALP